MTVPHFAFPFAPAGSSFAMHEQDTVAEITDCVKVLLMTPVGSRIVLPQYGVPETVFTQMTSLVPPDIIAKIREWEPRANVIMGGRVDDVDPKILRIVTQLRGGAA